MRKVWDIKEGKIGEEFPKIPVVRLGAEMA